MTLTNARGGCLCGAVRFAYDGEFGGALGKITVCLCGQCRRSQGLGAAVGPARAEDFRITRGAEVITEYESSPGKRRAFCRLCGSPLYSRRDANPEVLRLRLGVFDELPAGLRVEAQIFAEDAPKWTSFGGAPRYARDEPGRS